ncbi:hypothetical protein ACFP63_16260 [Oerskovia jenensis]|uniref:Uncharacterized protein n=1 Tax=Oerskovia jenensis TaxID=162169 RepID=A0ABS2LEE7_9CELL|nr:hypothetical protein [Oerskovia jenensis]MBM7478682.1 hypothetical protein [Oerskovia jenensis]
MLYLFAVVFGAATGVVLDHLKRERATTAMVALVLATGAGGGAFGAVTDAPYAVSAAILSLPLGMLLATLLRRASQR